MSPRAQAMRHTRLLSALLGMLLLVLAVRDIHGRLPFRPGLYLRNESLGTFADQVIHSACGDVKLPPLGEGQSVRLDLVPRPGCEYVIDHVTLRGDELLRLLELGREERADVVIEVGLDYVKADLARRHDLW